MMIHHGGKVMQINQTISLGGIKIELGKDDKYYANKLNLLCKKYNYRLVNEKDAKAFMQNYHKYTLVDESIDRVVISFEWIDALIVNIMINTYVFFDKEISLEIQDNIFNGDTLGIYLMCLGNNYMLKHEKLKLSFYDCDDSDTMGYKWIEITYKL